MSAESRSIGILGGTFDPVHNGHIAIARSFLESDFIQELWVFLTPAPPHKPDQPLTDYKLRYRMLKAAFKGFNHIRISDLESRLKQPSYTIQTLTHLTEKHPRTTFYLCMGEDSAKNFKTWHRWKDILSLSNLLVARRPSTDPTQIEDDLVSKIHFVDHNPIDISSTEIRKKVAQGKNISHLVPAEVEKIISEHKPYQTFNDE